MKKKIILLAPLHFSIYKMLIQNLEYLGFEVFFLHVDVDFKYQSSKDRIVNFLRKVFLGDKNYKKITLVERYYSKMLIPKLTNFTENHFDYALYIRSDIYPIDIIKRTSFLAKKSVAYQWDGINRYPEIFKRIELFDKFYVFEQEDYKKLKPKHQNLYLTQNFYPNIEEKTTDILKSDVYYIGTYIPDRFDDFINLYKKLSVFDLNFNILIASSNPKIISKYQNDDIKFLSKPIMYNENLSLLRGAKIVLDIKVTDHSGLSFRFFEAIKHRVKIITDNVSVKKYDFYHPNNIFILKHDSYENLKGFIESEYLEIDETIYEKYSFKSWISDILN